MADKSLDILIRTQAELQGAEAAAASLERQIGKAKATGEEYQQLEAKLATLKQSLDLARQALSEKAVELERVVAASAKYKAELAELEQQVKNLDARESWVKNIAPQELADSEARTRRMSDAVSSFTMVLNEEDAAQNELSKSVSKYTEEDLEKLFGKTGKTVSLKKQLKDAVKGLSTEFPILGRVAALALNPIAFSAAAGAAAFAIWRARVNELNSTLSNLELPDAPKRQIGEINQLAQAYRDLKSAIASVREEFNSPGGVFARATEDIDRFVEQQKKLMAARKAFELSQAKTEGERAGIEQRYAGAELALDEDAAKRKLARLTEQRANLITSGKLKMSEAEAIRDKVGFAGATESDVEGMKQQASQAEEEKKRREQDMKLLQQYKTDPASMSITDSLGVKLRILNTRKSVDELIGDEQSAIDRLNAPITRYQDYLQAKPQLERASKLVGAAQEDFAGAERIGLSLPRDQANLAQDIGLNRKVAGIERQTKVNELKGAKTEAEQGLNELVQEAVDALKTTGSISSDLTKELAAQQAELKALKTQIEKLSYRR